MASANAIPLYSSPKWFELAENPSTTHLYQKVIAQERLYRLQHPVTQQLIQVNARQVAQALLNGSNRLSFQLPESVACQIPGQSAPAIMGISPSAHKQSVGGWVASLQRLDLSEALGEKLRDLEVASDPAISTAAQLMRFAIAHVMVHDLLPPGKITNYQAVEGEDIPSIPCDELRDEPYSERFFQPQWISFDEQGRLLTSSILEAEDRMANMQRFLKTLQLAAVIDPFIVADPEYQRKRYGILGQLVNQGRALGRYWTCEIVAIIHRKLSAGKLDRGLSLSMPYFDERDLCMKMYDFEVIPTGRVTFVPAFVVISARNEQEKVFRNPKFNFGTRKYLLIQLDILEQAFLTDN